MVNGEESLASAFASGAANSAAAVVCAILSAFGVLQFCEHLTVSFDSPGPLPESIRELSVVGLGQGSPRPSQGRGGG